MNEREGLLYMTPSLNFMSIENQNDGDKEDEIVQHKYTNSSLLFFLFEKRHEVEAHNENPQVCC